MATLKDTVSVISAARSCRLRRAKTVLERTTKLLVEKYHVEKIVLIGSLADKERFGFHSDIDLCVEGLGNKEYFLALGEVLVEAGEFDVDIIPLEGATREMRERITKGKVLYEKG